MDYAGFDAFMRTLDTMPDFGMYRHAGIDSYLFKIFSKSYYSVPDPDRNFPFLDIFMFNASASSVVIGPYYTYDAKDVWPVKEASFMGLTVNVPQNASRVLEITYGKDVFNVCRSNGNHHRNLSYLKTQDIQCQKLGYIFDIYKYSSV